jgi:hypothetical protein
VAPSITQEEMAQAGYRTLCVAEKVLPAAAYEKWAEQYRAASVALQVRCCRGAEAGAALFLRRNLSTRLAFHTRIACAPGITAKH